MKKPRDTYQTIGKALKIYLRKKNIDVVQNGISAIYYLTD